MEASNVKAMRDALVQCELFLGHVSRHGHPTLNPGDKCTACDGADELRGMVARALATPPRNCDIGTAEEQAERMDAYCANHGEPIGSSWRCEKCPLCSINRCDLAWAQMPYAEERKGEGDGSK